MRGEREKSPLDGILLEAFKNAVSYSTRKRAGRAEVSADARREQEKGRHGNKRKMNES